jgi:ribosomal protein S18 acetylase RimI-like enzyme
VSDVQLRHVPDPPYDDLVTHLVQRRFLGEQDDPDRARDAAAALVGRIAERTSYRDVDADGEVAGGVWLVEERDDLAVLVLHLADTSLAPAVREHVRELAVAAGARRLTIGVWPDDPAAGAFVEGAGFEVSAVQMRLDLGGTLPTEEVVVVEPMDEATFEVWQADEVATYAEERTRAGETPERALEVAREQHAELLPDGLATEHQHFFVGRVDGEQVGMLWIGTERPLAFVYLVAVDAAHRRRGYGAGLMRGGALWVQARGGHALGLNVFGYNHGARALYDRLGYRVTELFMTRELR